MFDPQVPDEPPPPSYELSQETFDQKTQQGIQASLQPDSLADLWEEWDEAKFEANARSPTDGSSSSSAAASVPPVTAQQYPKEKAPRPPSPPPPEQEEPAVRPLRIVKKSQTAAYKKAVEARSYQSDDVSGSSAGGASLNRSFSVLSVGRRTPPPMFETLGPSLDGPDYDEVVMNYVPGDSPPTSPVSVLSNDSYRSPALPPQPQTVTSRPNPNVGTYHPPQPPPAQYQPAPRPTPSHVQRPQYPPSKRRIGFDPMSAYRSKSIFAPGLESTPEKVDPSAFYNSAVSAHLSTVPQRSAITPTHRANGGYQQQELQHPRPHHAMTFDSFPGMGNTGGMNMGRERPMSSMSSMPTDSSYYTNPSNVAPNRGWGAFHPNR